MIRPLQAFRFAEFLALLLLALYLSGCATGPAENRIDNIPMYGQPGISRPDALKKADEDFIKQASSGFGGSREKASKAWYAEGDRYMGQGNLHYAMRRYNQSWLLNPNNFQPYWGFGRVALERNKMDEAIEHLEKAVKLCDDSYQKVALLSDPGTGLFLQGRKHPGKHANRKKTKLSNGKQLLQGPHQSPARRQAIERSDARRIPGGARG